MAKTAPAMTSAPGPGGQGRPGGRNAVHILFSRDFGLFFVGTFLANCGVWFLNIAQALLIYRLTESTFLVGLLNFAQFAGVILLAPWAGNAADRFNRRQLLIVTQLGAMAITAVLALLTALNLNTIPAILGLVFLIGLTTAFASPAQQALVPALVPRPDLGAAVAMTSVTFNLARVIGPVTGTFVVSSFGVPWAIALNTLTYAVLVGALLFVRPTPQARAAGARPALRESLGTVRRDERLIALLGVVASVSFTLDPATTLSPAYAATVFRQPDTLVGFLIGAFGVGAVIAAFTASGGTATPYRRIGAMLSVSVFGLVLFALVPVLPVAFFALGCCGFGYLAGHTRANALLQLSVPDAQRGRVMAIWSVCFLGGRPMASLIDGAVASVAGVQIATLLMAIPPALAALTMFDLHRRGTTVGVAGDEDETEATAT